MPLPLKVSSPQQNGIIWLLVLVAISPLAGQELTTAAKKEFTRKLVAAAIERTSHHVRYISDYVPIPYPGGDVPADTGVCTDEIIRIYRAVGIDFAERSS